MPFSTPEKREFEANRITVKEFEDKLVNFINSELGMDIYKDDELLHYKGKFGEILKWVINIHPDDIKDSSDLY